MRIAVFGTRSYDRQFLSAANADSAHELTFIEPSLSAATAPLAAGNGAVCAFVNDTLDAATLEALAALGVKVVALRCAGYNNVDLDAAERLGLPVVRVPAYSPHAVAEFTICAILNETRLIRAGHEALRKGVWRGDLYRFDIIDSELSEMTVGLIGSLSVQASYLAQYESMPATALLHRYNSTARTTLVYSF